LDFTVRALLADQYAPITSQIGYVEVGLEPAVELYAAWLRGLGRPFEVRDLTEDGLPFAFHRLEPLTIPGADRQLLVEIGGWTAYFDNGLHGTDPVSPIGYLTRVARAQGLMICAIAEAGRRLGAFKWELLAPYPTAFLNYRRTVSLVHDDTRWIFETYGDPLPFEDVERYAAPRKRDRFDSSLIEAYSHELGLRVFDPNAYGPRIALIETERSEPRSTEVTSMSLIDAQSYLGIQPGRAASLTG
jgi:hypothetical protein